MKRPRKPTLAQKKLIRAAGLIWENWNVVQENARFMVLVSKKSEKRRYIFK